MEYSPEFKKNHATAYLAEEFERLEKAKDEARQAAGDDAELARLAADDLAASEARQAEILAEIERILAKEKEEAERPKALILEFRAGAGGDEATLFAKELREMYQKYAEGKRWRVTPVDDMTLEIHGSDAYDALRYETGVHRVQRVPLTEKSGRVHTSTASVAALPIRSKPTIDINPADIHMEFSRSGGAGGQNVNKRETAVRITHAPTSLSVHVSSERSQQANREKAMELIKAKVFALEEEKKKAEAEGRSIAKITANEWGSQIRSYVLHPYKMVKDHRTGHESGNPDKVLEGDLDDFIDAAVSETSP